MSSKNCAIRHFRKLLTTFVIVCLLLQLLPARALAEMAEEIEEEPVSTVVDAEEHTVAQDSTDDERYDYQENLESSEDAGIPQEDGTSDDVAAESNPRSAEYEDDGIRGDQPEDGIAVASEDGEAHEESEKSLTDAGSDALVDVSASNGFIASGTCGTCSWDISGDGTLTIHEGVLASNDAGSATFWPWDEWRGQVVSIVTDGAVAGSGSMKLAFSEMSKLETADLSGLDVAHVTNMGYMFSGGYSLSELNTSGWDTSRVTDMHAMFQSCQRLSSLDVSKWDTSSLKDISWMFNECRNLSSLDVSGWDTSSVTDMSSMFRVCKLDSLDVSGWDTSSVTDMSAMFDCCPFSSLDVSKWDTSSVTNMTWMFNYCESLSSLDVSGWDTSSVTDMSGVFRYCSSLSSLDVSGWDTSSAINMGNMFYACSSLSSLDVSRWDTSSVTDMGSMFRGCSSLSSLDVSRWDVSSATYMADLFFDCSSLSYLDVSNWDVSSGPNIVNLFWGCSHLTSLDLSGWNTSSIIGMVGLFGDCTSLVSLNLSGWDTSSVQYMRAMFYRCSSLRTILVGKGWDTSGVSSSDNMFMDCVKLVGGNGTAYDENHVDAEYARIDSEGSPGYLKLSGSASGAHYPTSYRGFRQDSYSFENFSAYIPYGYWRTMYEDGVARMFFDHELGLDSLGGVCYGMALTTASILSGYPSASSFERNGESAVNIRDLKLSTSASTLDGSAAPLTETLDLPIDSFIKYGQIYQFSSEEQTRTCYWHTELPVVEKTGLLLDRVKRTVDANQLDLLIHLNRAGAGHSVLVIGYEGNDILVDDPNNTEEPERITVHEDGTWEFSGYGGFSSSAKESSLSVSTPSHVTRPYEILSSGAATRSISDKTGSAGDVIVLGTERLDKDNTLLRVSADKYSLGNAECVPLQGADGNLVDESIDTTGMYWVLGTNAVEVTGLEGEACVVEIGADDMLVSTEVADGSSVSTTIDGTESAVEVSTEPGNSVSISLQTPNEDGVGTAVTMSGIATGAVSIGSIDGGYSARGFEELTARVETPDGVKEAHATAPDGNEMSLLVDDTGGDVTIVCDGQVASGTSGTCSWDITEDGTLTIHSGVLASNESGDIEGFWPWQSWQKQVKSVVLDGHVAGSGSLANAFYNMRALETADLSELDTSQVTDMSGMFSGCSALTSLDVSNWDVSRVTDLERMFSGCTSLTSLDLHKWDTSCLKSTVQMFEYCSSLDSLSVCDWNTSSITAMIGMFEGCSSLTSLDLSKWDTSNVTHVRDMFRDCSLLRTIRVGDGWNTSSVYDSTDMFVGCLSLVGGDGTVFDSSHVDAEYARVDSPDAPGYLTRTAIDLSTAKVAVARATYNGKAQEPAVTVTYDGTKLVAGTDYTVTYDDNTNAGTATVIVTGQGLYKGTASGTFTIARAKATVTANNATKVFGEADTTLSAVVSGTFGGDSIDYTVIRAAGESAGTYAITVSGNATQGNYDVTFVAGTFTITAKSLDGAKVASIENQPLGGKPVPAVMLDGRTLVEGTDFTVSYDGNDVLGTATVKITGTGNYVGELSATFEVMGSIEDALVTASSQTYTGEALTPDVTVTLGGKTLVAGTEYEVVTRSYVDAGDYEVSVKGVGGYAGVAKGKFTVNKAAQTVTASDKSVAMGKTVSLAAKASAGGKLSYKSASVKVATVSAAGKVTPVKVGSVKITITAAATDNYKAATKTVTVKVTKGVNPIAAKATKATVQVAYATVKSKAVVTAKNVTVSKAQGTLSYANASTNATAKRFAVNSKTGKVTVPKGTKAGTYAVRVKVTAAGNANWNAGSKYVTYKVKVYAANTLKAVRAKASVTASCATLRSKAVVTARNVTVTGARGTVSYANASTNATAKKFAVNRATGKVTVPKGTKKGTYAVKVKVTAAGTAAYAARSVTVTYNVVVR